MKKDNVQQGWIEARVDASSNAIVWKNDHQDHVARYDHTCVHQDEPDMRMVEQLMQRHEDEKYEFLMANGIDEYKKHYGTRSLDSDSESESCWDQDSCDVEAQDDVGDY